MSVSDDVSDELGGGTLQLWRVNDLIYREEAEVLAELEKHRQTFRAHIHCNGMTQAVTSNVQPHIAVYMFSNYLTAHRQASRSMAFHFCPGVLRH